MFLCSELIPVLFEDATGRARREIVNLEEISANSAVILAEQEFERGCPIAMSIKGNELYGEVKNCTYEETLGWFVDIQLHRDSRWCGQRFLPDHFLAMPIEKPSEVGQPTRVLV